MSNVVTSWWGLAIVKTSCPETGKAHHAILVYNEILSTTHKTYSHGMGRWRRWTGSLFFSLLLPPLFLVLPFSSSPSYCSCSRLLFFFPISCLFFLYFFYFPFVPFLPLLSFIPSCPSLVTLFHSFLFIIIYILSISHLPSPSLLPFSLPPFLCLP